MLKLVVGKISSSCSSSEERLRNTSLGLLWPRTGPHTVMKPKKKVKKKRIPRNEPKTNNPLHNKHLQLIFCRFDSLINRPSLGLTHVSLYCIILQLQNHLQTGFLKLIFNDKHLSIPFLSLCETRM